MWSNARKCPLDMFCPFYPVGFHFAAQRFLDFRKIMAGNDLPAVGLSLDPNLLVALSQHPDFIVNDSSGDMIVDAGFSFVEGNAPDVAGESQQQNRLPAPVVAGIEDVDARAVEEVVASQRRKNKKKGTFSNKMLLATSDLFLDDIFSDRFTDKEVVIFGRVCECPREKMEKYSE